MTVVFEADREVTIAIAPNRLEGGLLNKTSKITTQRGDFILKEYLKKPKLLPIASVPGGRYEIEKNAYETLAEILPGLTPKLIETDDKKEILILEMLDGSRRLDKVWGETPANTFYEIGRTIALISNKTFGRRELLSRFNNTDFQELKYDSKYYKTTENWKELHDVREKVMAITRNDRTALALGDIRLTNIFAFTDGSFKFIDFEGTHFAEPSFDIAYFLGELIVRYLDNPNDSLCEKILEAWRGYGETLTVGRKDNEYLVVKHIGFHMLDQLTGHIKSDYAFLKNKEKLVERAKQIILNSNTVLSLVCKD